MKPIYFTKHSQVSMRKRGVNEVEVETAIREAPWISGKWGRLECSMNFPYNREWNRKFYRTKQVVPVFIEEADQIVVVTVYAFYF